MKDHRDFSAHRTPVCVLQRLEDIRDLPGALLRVDEAQSIQRSSLLVGGAGLPVGWEVGLEKLQGLVVVAWGRER